jgi:2-isopropylmalate synthase
VVTDAAHGTGPIDAIYQAINRVINRPNELIEFAIKAITEGIDAVAEVTVRIREQGGAENGSVRRGPQVFSGYSINTDTMVAAAEAYMGALNKLLSAREERIKAERAAYAAGYDQNAPSYAVDPFGNSVLGKTE